MKRIAALAALLTSLAIAAPASAAPISKDYCDLSLHGGGSLAPDNDIQIAIDNIQSHFEHQITRVTLYSTRLDGPDNRYITYMFWDQWGGIVAHPDLHCYRKADGIYHDTRLSINLVP
jgi:hypothetical protein